MGKKKKGKNKALLKPKCKGCHWYVYKHLTFPTDRWEWCCESALHPYAHSWGSCQDWMRDVEKSYKRKPTQEEIELYGKEYLMQMKKTHENYLRSDNIIDYQLTLF